MPTATGAFRPRARDSRPATLHGAVAGGPVAEGTYVPSRRVIVLCGAAMPLPDAIGITESHQLKPPEGTP